MNPLPAFASGTVARVPSRIVVRALQAGAAEVLIYGEIGESFFGDSVTARSVVEQLAGLAAKTISVRINSIGGSVADGLAIYNALKAHPARVVVTIDGQAASIASLVAMAGDEVLMPANALMMLHAPWSAPAGNANDLREMADVLDQHAQAMATSYAAKTRKPAAEILALLGDGKDHWFTAAEAVAYGLADRVLSEDAPKVDDNAAAAAALLGYCATVANAPSPISRELRARIHAACNPSVFACVEASAQQLIVDHLEDPEMKQRFSAIMANGAGPTPPPIVAADPVAALNQRNSEVRASFAGFRDHPGVSALEADCLADASLTVDQARAKLLARLGAGAEPLNVGGSGAFQTRDMSNGAGSDFVRAATDGILLRAGFSIEQPHAGARDFRRYSVHEIARAALSRAGRNSQGFGHGEGPELIRAALTTSDFPFILENSLGKALRIGFESEPQSHRLWSRRVTVPDFKEQSRVLLGSAPALDLVTEHGEYKNGSMEEDKASYSVEKFGKIISVSWEMLVNDDLEAFMRTPQAMGQAARRKEADIAYALFSANSGNGQTMQDAVTLFHANHNNIATSASALDASSLGAARVKLRTQTGIGGEYLNLVPAFLIVPPALEQAAEVVIAASQRRASQGSNNAMQPDWIGGLSLVVEPRLAATAFYLAASPSQIDTLEVAGLAADNGEPVLIEEEAFRVDAKSWKVRHVVGARFLDWRGIVKTPIA